MLAAALQKGTNAGLMEMNSQQWSALSKAEKNDNVSQAFSNMAQATRAVEQATTTSQNLSTTSSMSLLTLANNLRSTDAWHKLANFGRNLSISERSHFSALSTKYQSLLGGDAAQGQVVAALDYMSKRATTNAGFAESLSGYLAQSNVPIGSDMPHQTVTGDIQKLLHDSIKYPPIDNRNDPPRLSKEVLSHAKKKEDHGLRCVQQWRIKNHDQTRRKSEDPAPDTR